MTNTGLARRITCPVLQYWGALSKWGASIRSFGIALPPNHSQARCRANWGCALPRITEERGTTRRLHNRSTVCSFPQHTQRTQLVTLDMCILLLGTNKHQGHLQYRLETNDIKGMFNTLDSDKDKMVKCQFPT